jgi:hypothetical protein
MSQENPKEILSRIKLLMEYDMGKTLTENENVIQEQDVNEYFTTVAKSVMNNPNQVSKINFGNPTVDVEKACMTIKDAIEGMGTDKKGINYVLDNAFKDIANTIAIIKKYPSIAGESLFDALEGEWFISSTKNKVITKVAQQLGQWCQSNPTQKICKPRSKDELKYGTY